MLPLCCCTTVIAISGDLPALPGIHVCAFASDLARLLVAAGNAWYYVIAGKRYSGFALLCARAVVQHWPLSIRTYAPAHVVVSAPQSCLEDFSLAF